jgi:hypothetical protein
MPLSCGAGVVQVRWHQRRRAAGARRLWLRCGRDKLLVGSFGARVDNLAVEGSNRFARVLDRQGWTTMASPWTQPPVRCGCALCLVLQAPLAMTERLLSLAMY